MRPTSIVGPLILVAMGVVLLWSNLSNDFSLLDSLTLHWPWILVVWGFVRLCEIALWHRNRKALPIAGVSGGEWFFVVVLCVVGAGLYFSNLVFGDRADAPFRLPMAQMFGENYDFSLPEQSMAMKAGGQLLVENLRGEVVITGTDTDQIVLTGTEQIKEINQDKARERWQSRKVTIEENNGVTVIRSNLEGIDSDHEMRSALRIRVPRQTQVRARGRKVDFEVSQVQGNVDLQSDEGNARLVDIQGEARVRMNRSRDLRFQNISGAIEIHSSRGGDLYVENARERVSAIGSFSGDIQLRQLLKPVHIEDRNLDFRTEALTGEVQANRGSLTAHGLRGPTRIASESKDVELDRFQGPLEVILEKRDATIRQTDTTIAPMDLQVRRGKVTLELSPKAKFRMEGRARQGEIRNDMGNRFQVDGRSKESRISGGDAGAPLISVDAERIELTSTEGEPARP